MDLNEKLVEARRAAGTTAYAVAVTLAVVCLYVLNRAANVALGTSRLSDAAIQATFADLPFSFLTLSVLWPLIVGALCLVLIHIVEHERSVGALLRTHLPDVPAEVLDAVSSTGGIANPSTSLRRGLRALYILPTLTLFIHAASLIASLIRSVAHQGWTSRSFPDSALLVVALLAVGIALSWTDALRRSAGSLGPQ